MTTDNHDERRRFHRILFDAPAIIESRDTSYTSTLLDISLNGALINHPDGWSPAQGEEVALTVLLAEEEPKITMNAIVAHVEGKQIGLRCVHIDMESISHLRRLVELNLGDAELLERELEALG
jgi:c-di-GMP-binding flagellar brake protein YcgR